MIDQEMYEDLEKMVVKDLEKIIDKGDMTAADADSLTKGLCLLEKVKKHIMGDAMEEEEYSQRYYPRYPMNSYECGRSPQTGRYMSRDNGSGMRGANSRNSYTINWAGGRSRDYSQHGDDMIEHLEIMRDQAATEQERRMIDQWIESAMTV